MRAKSLLIGTVLALCGTAADAQWVVTDPGNLAQSIINNSDCKILLDQRKYMNKFEHIQRLLGLTDKEKGQILSINQANHPGRSYREVWIGLGGTHSAVYATEVSEEEYFTFSTEESEKLEVQRLAEESGGDLEAAVRRMAEKRREEQRQTSTFKQE